MCFLPFPTLNNISVRLLMQNCSRKKISLFLNFLKYHPKLCFFFDLKFRWIICILIIYRLKVKMPLSWELSSWCLCSWGFLTNVIKVFVTILFHDSPPNYSVKVISLETAGGILWNSLLKYILGLTLFREEMLPPAEIL